MKYQIRMGKIVSLTVLITIIVSTWAEVIIDDSKTGVEHVTILPGGTKLCSQSGSTGEKNLSLNETAYIFINSTMSLSFESPCFKKKYIMKFSNNEKYNKVNPKSILQITFTSDQLFILTKDDIKYSENHFKKINSEISNNVDCLKRSQILKLNILEENKYSWPLDKTISEENKYNWFMDSCDLFFERRNEDFLNLCPVFHGVSSVIYDKVVHYQSYAKSSSSDSFLSDIIVIKPISTKVRIETQYCNDQYLLTEFIPKYFLNHGEDKESWFKFDYDVIKSGYKSSLTISIAGIPIDHMSCYINWDEEPKFSFDGVSDIKTACIHKEAYDFNHNYYAIPDEIPQTSYTRTSYTINFPYMILLIMILVGKAICGYSIYKRRQARLITFTSSRLVEHYGNVSPLGRGAIIVAANGNVYPRQPTSQFDPPPHPSEDLPPAYNDLQQPDDINPPGYEDAIKSHSKSPAGYEHSCRDNTGFQEDAETSTVIRIIGDNQLSTNDSRAVSSDIS